MLTNVNRLLALVIAASAHGAIIFNTTPQAATGVDIDAAQAAAVQFIPSRDCILSGVAIALSSNIPEGQEAAPLITISIQAGAGGPSGEVLDSWTRGCSSPSSLQPLSSERRPALHAGTAYWIVAQSACDQTHSPIWNHAATAAAPTAVNTGSGWTRTGGPALAVQVFADVSCTQDFDGDGDTATDHDLESFFACLAGSCCESCASADFNADGDESTDADIESFFRVLAGGTC